MASIFKLPGRKLPWRAQVKQKGHPKLIKHFPNKKQAERWAAEQEASIRNKGLPLTIEELKKQTVGDIVRRYRDEITPTKGSHVSESTVLNRFLQRDICQKSLAYLSPKDGYDYLAERLKETWRGKPITPRTIRREVNSIQHIFEVARKRWGLTNLVNPFRGLEIKGSMYRRRRRLEEGELERLMKACEQCRGLNRIYVPLAIYLAIETGMRLQEIFNLHWTDLDPPKRRIVITKSKTDYASEYAGRTIVMTMNVFPLIHILTGLTVKDDPHWYDKPLWFGKCIFPMTKMAFKQTWGDVVKRAGITDLTFHDLRREAGSRFDEAGLTKGEHDLMMGHRGSDMTSLYIHADLKSIQDKLDRYLFEGKTFEEAYEQALKNIKGRTVDEQRKLFKAAYKPGMTFQEWHEATELVDEEIRKESKPGDVSKVVPFQRKRGT
jgi:integrase